MLGYTGSQVTENLMFVSLLNKCVGMYSYEHVYNLTSGCAYRYIHNPVLPLSIVDCSGYDYKTLS